MAGVQSCPHQGMLGNPGKPRLSSTPPLPPFALQPGDWLVPGGLLATRSRSVGVVFLLLPGETGQPSAQQHGRHRAGPRAVIRPADLAASCRPDTGNQEPAFKQNQWLGRHVNDLSPCPCQKDSIMERDCRPVFRLHSPRMSSKHSLCGLRVNCRTVRPVGYK